MTQQKRKLHVAVLYGGRSGEHEVSLQSAASVLRHLDPQRFVPLPVAIDKDGRWHPGDLSRIEQGSAALPVFASEPPVFLPPNPPASDQVGWELSPQTAALSQNRSLPPIDVVFPVLHGTYCEDGTLQGLLELADVPYVGCGVLASAIGMDKEVAKRLAGLAGLLVVPSVSVSHRHYDAQALAGQVAQKLGFPCFVKPAGSGSSVGVHKVRKEADLDAAVRDAFRFDRKVLIEQAISAREIEVAVLENPLPGQPPLCSVVGEIEPRHEFYSYQAKYLDENGAALLVPAPLAAAQADTVRRLAALAFTTLECEGLARVDFFLDRTTGDFYFNEVNTLPGFTSISMYPRLWEASGLPYRELLSRLIDLALLHHGEKKALVRDFRQV